LYGVAQVLSAIDIAPWPRARFATFSMSVIPSMGLLGVSTNTSFVVGRNARSYACRLGSAMSVVSMP
jgi:hypothetical protein